MNPFTPQVVIPLSIISFFVVTTNIAVCLLVYKIKNMRSYTNGFVVSLALSDILTGITLFIHYNAELEKVSRIAINILYALVLFCGVWNICAVTFDRYLAVVKPFAYRTVIPRFFKISLPMIWTLSLGIAILPAIAWRGNINLLINKIYIFFTFFFCAVLPFAIIVYANLRIYLTVRRCVKKERELSICTEIPRTDLKESKRRAKKMSTEAKVAKVFALAALMFILSWFPIFVYSGAFVFDHTNLVPNVILDISPFTIAIGSLVNPILYSFMKPDFRYALLKLLRQHRLVRRDLRSHRSASYIPSNGGFTDTIGYLEKNNNQKSPITQQTAWNESCTDSPTSKKTSVKLMRTTLLSAESSL